MSEQALLQRPLKCEGVAFKFMKFKANFCPFALE